VVRPTSLTWLTRGSTPTGSLTGSHMQPLVAARAAETKKLRTYSAECAHHGWRMVPFALESYGAKGNQADRLLQQLSAHSLDRSPESFLTHADRVLSVALQVGNAGVAGTGTAELHLQAYRRGTRDDQSAAAAAVGRAPMNRRPTATAAASALHMRMNRSEIQLSSLMHPEYHSARIGVAAA
jgi:hypothetical protein